MDKTKEIFQLIKEEKYEEAVVQGIQYFQLGFFDCPAGLVKNSVSRAKCKAAAQRSHV